MMIVLAFILGMMMALPAAKYPANLYDGNEQTQPVLPPGGTDIANADDYNQNSTEIVALETDLRAANVNGGQANHAAVHNDQETRIDALESAGAGGGLELTSLKSQINNFDLIADAFSRVVTDSVSNLVYEETIAGGGIRPSSITSESSITITDPFAIISSAVFSDSTIILQGPFTISVRVMTVTLNGNESPGDTAQFDWTWNGVPVRAELVIF